MRARERNGAVSLRGQVFLEDEPGLDELLCEVRGRRGDRSEQLDHRLLGEQARVLVDDDVAKVVDEVAPGLLGQVVTDEDRLFDCRPGFQQGLYDARSTGADA